MTFLEYQQIIGGLRSLDADSGGTVSIVPPPPGQPPVPPHVPNLWPPRPPFPPFVQSPSTPLPSTSPSPPPTSPPPASGICIEGYWPLYATLNEALALSPTNGVHTHTFGGTGWYMPNDFPGLQHYPGWDCPEHATLLSPSPPPPSPPPPVSPPPPPPSPHAPGFMAPPNSPPDPPGPPPSPPPPSPPPRPPPSPPPPSPPPPIIFVALSGDAAAAALTQQAEDQTFYHIEFTGNTVAAGDWVCWVSETLSNTNP